MAELAVNGGDKAEEAEPASSQHQQAVKELEKQATSLDSGGQPFADPRAVAGAGQSGQILSPTGLTGRPDTRTLDAVKQWGVSTYKCTKQLVSEKMGKSSRTADPELESAIAGLRDSQRRYQCLLNLASSLARHFQSMLETQRVLAEAFRDMGRTESELANEFAYNCQTQVALATNGQQLLSALNFFCGSLTTLVTKTFEDTLATVTSYEYARIEYDAYRVDLEGALSSSAQKDLASKAGELRAKVESQRTRYERLRQDVRVKIQLLDENRVRVMQKQLLLFHNAVSAYFSGNQAALEATMKQFSVRPKSGCPEKQAFLEQRRA